MDEYHFGQLDYHIGKIKEEMKSLEEKYSSSVMSVHGEPLKIMPKFPSYYESQVNEGEIEHLLKEIDDYEGKAIAVVILNKGIIERNKASYNVAHDVIKGFGLSPTYYGVPKGKRTAKILQSNWVIDLINAFPMTQDYTEDGIKRSCANARDSLNKLKMKFESIKAEKQREEERKAACAIRVKKLGVLISKYNLPIESSKEELIKEMFKRNPYLLLVVSVDTNSYFVSKIDSDLSKFKELIGGLTNKDLIICNSINHAIDVAIDEEEEFTLANEDISFEELKTIAQDYNREVYDDYYFLE